MKKQNGFTLVELLIVIMIIGILATMAVPQYNKMVNKAKWTEAVSILGQLKNACEIYYAEHSKYPNSTTLHTYLNGPAPSPDPGLLVDIPSNSKFIYFLVGAIFDDIQKFEVSAFIDSYSSNGALDTSGQTYLEPIIGLFGDGTWDVSNGGAPQF